MVQPIDLPDRPDPFRFTDIPEPTRFPGIPEALQFAGVPKTDGSAQVSTPSQPPVSDGGGASAWNGNTTSVDFDGTDDYISTGLTTLVSTWSVSAWFKPEFTGAGSYFITGRSTSKRLGMYYNGSSFIDYYLRQSGSPFNILNVRSTDLSVLTQWNHLVWTKDNATTTVTMYLNGSQIDQDSGASSAASDFYPEVIGAINTSGTFGFKGKIDEFGWWDSTALSSSDVTAIYNSGVPDDLSSYSPVGWWRMGDDDSGTGTTITDQGSGGNDGTLVNGPTFSTTVP